MIAKKNWKNRRNSGMMKIAGFFLDIANVMKVGNHGQDARATDG